ncbi:MAG: radical SAM protein [Terriglobia bacterium]
MPVNLMRAAHQNAETASGHEIHSLPVLVILPHSRCNCHCMMCDIWRIRETREITAGDLEPHLESLRALQVRWVVLSGGEPQLHSDFRALTGMLRLNGFRLTLLTAGLLLEAHASSVADSVDDVIVSLDGPPEIHDRVRGVRRAFELLAQGVEALKRRRPGMIVSGRSTVQKVNFRYLRQTVHTAKRIGLDSISFLAVDLGTDAFNRPAGWSSVRQSTVALDSDEVDDLEQEIKLLTRENSEDIARGYIAETPEKLRRIILHFRAHLGQARPIAPRCNAPWVSAVIESDGTVRPCFFHHGLGNVRASSLRDILNGPTAIEFRQRLDISTNPVCQRCVCSLYIPQAS